MDFSEHERECRSMGGLFQEIVHEMKSSSSVWQDFTAKANKLHQALGTSTAAIGSFLDSLQKVADMANNSKGAVKDIGATLTRLCLRQRSLEEKMKDYVTILGGTFSPIPGLLDDWKRCVVQLDHSHAKDFKKVDREIQRSASEVKKLKKQIDKGGNAAKLQPSLDSKVQSLQFKYTDLLTNESVALKKLALHERQRFSFFVKCLMPLLEKQSEMLGELSHLDDVNNNLLIQTKDSECIIKHCEEFVDDFRNSDSCHEQAFVTPPSSPMLSRHSSSLSIRSNNSNYSNIRRSLGKQPQQHNGFNSDRNSEYSLYAPSTSETESRRTTLTQAVVDDDITPTVTPTVAPKNPSNNYNTPTNNNYNNDNTYSSPNYNNNDGGDDDDEGTLRKKSSTKGGFFSNFRNSNSSLSKASNNNRKSFSSKPSPNNNNNNSNSGVKRSQSKLDKREMEDGEFLMGHRNIQRNHLRNSIAVPNRKDISQSPSLQSLPTKQPLHPLESPLRPGRRVEGSSSRLEADEQLKRAADGGRYSSNYATLGRNSYRSFNPVRSSFMGSSYSHAARLSETFLPSSPPPPPPIFNAETDQQIATLLKTGVKKTSAPLPPRNSFSKHSFQPQTSLPTPPQPPQLSPTPKTTPPQRPPPFLYSPQQQSNEQPALHTQATSPIPPQRHSTQFKQQSPPPLLHPPYVQPQQQLQQQPQQQIQQQPQQQLQQQPQQQPQQPQQSQQQIQPLLPQQQLQIQQINKEIQSHVQQQQQTQQPPQSPPPQQQPPPPLQQQQQQATSPSQPPQRPKYVPYSIKNNVIIPHTSTTQSPIKSPTKSPTKSPPPIIPPIYKEPSFTTTKTSHPFSPSTNPSTSNPFSGTTSNNATTNNTSNNNNNTTNTNNTNNNNTSDDDVTVIPIRILHKYSDGLAGMTSPDSPSTNKVSLTSPPSTSDPKPYPPLRNTSMTFDTSPPPQQPRRGIRTSFFKPNSPPLHPPTSPQ